MKYESSLSSAQEYSRYDRTEEWIHLYLRSDGNNVALSDGLKLFPRYFLGPVYMPLSLFTRCTGPEENMKYRVDPQYFEKHVKELSSAIDSGSDMPPLIIHYLINDGNSEFELTDGNHRHEAYSRLGITEIPVTIWISEKTELDRFLLEYSSYLQ